MNLITFDSPDQAAQSLKADLMCKTIGSALKKHYANRAWYVEVSLEGGVAKILCPSISSLHGFVIHIHSRTNDQIEKEVIRAGGQILEMFKLSRERGAKGGEENLQRNLRGEVIQAATGL